MPVSKETPRSRKPRQLVFPENPSLKRSPFLRVLLPRERVADLLSVSLRTVDHLLMNGDLRSVKLGHRRLVSLGELFVFAEGQHDDTGSNGVL